VHITVNTDNDDGDEISNMTKRLIL